MWLIPSRRRIDKLRTFCNSAVKAETTTPALIIIDAKDYKDNQPDYSNLEMYHFPNPEWKIYISDAEGMGPKVRETHSIWRDRAWVGILNDDHFIVTKKWDTRLISQLNGKNFLTCNDRWNAPKRAAGATLFSMPLMEAFGFPMFPKQIDHLGIDDVFEIIGRNTGCWEVDMSVIVEHHHAFKNPDSIDETHKRVYGTKPWQDAQGKLSPEGQATHDAFQDWLKNDAPQVVTRVRELRKLENLSELPRKVALETPTVPVSTNGG